MLELLHIENIAIIEQSEITFEAGFNVLTGETGAGKSIVIDAMSAVLGQRASRELIRTGAGKAFVSALFSHVAPEVSALAGIDADEDGNLMLQREIYPDGKNVCRVNSRPVTVAQLKALGRQLLNIHGQHEGQLLLDEEQHLLYLDQFGKLDDLLFVYAEKYNAFTALQRKRDALQMDEAEKARRVDTLTYQINELERAKLRPGEEEELLSRRNLLRNAEKFTSALAEADYCLNGGEDSGGALQLLRQAQDAISGVKSLDDSYMELYQKLEQVYSDLFDAADTVQEQRDAFDFSPNELDDVEGRLDKLYRLKKKYGATVEDMLAYLDKCRQELDNIRYADDMLAKLEKDLSAAQKDAQKAAAALSKARKAAARELERRILEELRQLDMGKLQFVIDVSEKNMDGNGADSVRFLFSANAGEEPRPLNKVASGGELARVMLGMKNVLSEQDHVATMVFDEVDTGVSGRAAQKVAEKMAAISRHKQVLCVTHLPQLSAMADTHFKVEKGEKGGRTYTQVTLLSREQRRQEIARLTGGSRVTETMLSGAEELLSEADAFRKTLT